MLALVSCASTRSGDSGTSANGAGAEVGAGITPPEAPLREDETRVPGVLADPADVSPVQAPASVAAAERFTITITTTGSGCDRLGDTGVLLGEREATIYVYDYTSANRPGVACTMIFKHLKREVPLTFREPGEVVIRVWGRRPTAEGTLGGEPQMVERRVRVRS
jgi:hypothetical protein